MAAREQWLCTDQAATASRAQGLQENEQQLRSYIRAEQRRGIRANPSYLSQIQHDRLGPETRSMLVGWIFKAAQQARIPESGNTAILATHYVDRCMSRTPVGYVALQPLAATCLWIAAKMQHGEDAMSFDIHRPRRQLEYELFVLRILRWHLTLPTPAVFVHVLCRRFWIAPELACEAQKTVQRFQRGESPERFQCGQLSRHSGF